MQRAVCRGQGLAAFWMGHWMLYGGLLSTCWTQPVVAAPGTQPGICPQEGFASHEAKGRLFSLMGGCWLTIRGEGRIE